MCNRFFQYLMSLLTLLCLSYSGYSWAADQAAPPVSPVVAGVYVNQVYAVSLKDNKFTVDFYVWFRYKDDKLAPLDTFELTNGRIESKSGVVKKKINGVNYAACRVVATINKFWDVSRYPLDNHELVIELEDAANDISSMIYTLDTVNSGISPDGQVRGWKVAGFKMRGAEKSYKTNYGDISLPTGNVSTYSRVSAVIEVERQGIGQFVKLFSIMFLAIFVSFLSFLVPAGSGPRFGLGTGALFAAAANSFVVSSSLPDSHKITMADALQISSIFFIFVGLTISTVALKLANSGNDQGSKRLDRISFIVLPIIFLITTFFIIKQF